MCKYCHDTGVIDDVHEWIRAARDIELEEMKSRGWTWKTMLKECRNIRDGWIGKASGRRNYYVDCIECI